MKKSLVYLAGASLVLAVGGYQVAADTLTASPSLISATNSGTRAQVQAQLVNNQPSLLLTNLVSESETSQITVTVTSQSGYAHTYNMSAQADGSYVVYLDANFHQFDSSQFSAQFTLQKADGQTETLASYHFDWLQEPSETLAQLPETDEASSAGDGLASTSPLAEEEAAEASPSETAPEVVTDDKSSQAENQTEPPSSHTQESSPSESQEPSDSLAIETGSQPALSRPRAEVKPEELVELSSKTEPVLEAPSEEPVQIRSIINAPATSNATARATTTSLADVEGHISIQNQNNQLGMFDVVITDVRSRNGLSSVIVPVWSELGGQDDIKWYEAGRQADGSYKVSVKASDHKNNMGLYHAHLYYRLPDGNMKGVGVTQTILGDVLKGNISIQNKNDQAGSFDVLVSDVYSSAGLKTVTVPVWSETGGQDDIKWYQANRQNDGTYKVNVKVGDHKNSRGLYHAHLYYTLNDGSFKAVGGTQTLVAETIKGNISIQNKNDQAGSFDVVVSDVQSSAGLKSVTVPVWSEANGQDDMKWYQATKQADGTYKVSVKASDHKNSRGLYHAHLYYTLGDDSFRGVGGTQTVLSDAVKGQITIQNKNDQAGRFEVLVSGVQSPGGLKAVLVPVWSEAGGQDDIKWYEANRQNDGNYKAQVDISNHKYSTGLYHAHLYYKLDDDSLKAVGGTQTRLVDALKGTIAIQNKNNETGSFDVLVSGIQGPSGVKSVVVPVWSETSGQDDIKWYEASRQTDGTYKVHVEAGNHKYSTGLYHAHLYYRLGDDSFKAVGGTQTQVSISQAKPSADIRIENVNHQAGSFDVLVSNITSPYGIKEIQIPVWSETGGQDDIVWYKATAQADGTYKVSVYASRHKSNGGLYHAHPYLVQGNDVRVGLGGESLDLNYQKTRSKTIFIDPGHGGTDPGAVYGGVQEKHLALSVANLLKAKLQANGYTVIMSRTGDQSVDFTKERSRMANKTNADIFVSIHFNASGAGKTTANGIETYWYQYYPAYQPSINQAMHNDPTRLAESETLAKSVQQNLVSSTGATNRGVKRATFAVLRETAIPSVLVELGYMDNPSDLAKISTAAYQEKLATGLANGILSWYGTAGGKA